MNAFKRVIIWAKVSMCYFLTFPGIKSSIYSPEETVKLLLGGKSLIRFGDGEFGIYRKNNIHYQKWSSELNECFKEIKQNYEAAGKNCEYILAVPKKFMTINGFQLAKKRVYVSSWAQSRYDFKKNFRHDLSYGDSFLFEKKNKEIYSQLWNNENCPLNVIFVHNSESYANLFRDTYHKKTVFVQCPRQNAFEVIDDLENEIMENIEENRWNSRNVMLTISAGPAGKVLVYRFSKKGYWCIDAGHCWDDPLEGD